MSLLTFTDPKQDGGVAFEWPEKDRETGVAALFYIRRIPRAVEVEIEERHDARVQQFLFDKGGAARMRIEADKQEAIGRDRAVYALVRTEHFTGKCADAASAAIYSKLTGTEVPVGKPFSFDSCLTDAVKAHLFAEFVNLRGWVLACEASLNLNVERRDVALAKN